MLNRETPENDIYELSENFAVRIVNLCRYLKYEKKENIMSQQIIRSGTSIGANAHEAKFAQSRADFRSKMNIALKEANETGYWLRILRRTDYITDSQFDSINNDCSKIIATLIKIVKKTTT